jgi:hypothetical protein
VCDLNYSENTILYYPECIESNLLESYETKSVLGNIHKYNKFQVKSSKYSPQSKERNPQQAEQGHAQMQQCV